MDTCDLPPCYWAVVPAAGIGRRMGSATPKQYLPIRGVPILQHTLQRLAGHPAIDGVIVALATDDVWWPTVNLEIPATNGRSTPIYTAQGGSERSDSVRGALLKAMGPAIGAKQSDWVLVHDAVRPCLPPGDIDLLITSLSQHPVGGLLGSQVRDTMKRTGKEGNITGTVEREGLWHALTPQMFRLGSLLAALEMCAQRNLSITDEAQAMELIAGESNGPMPRMVEGSAGNIKVTRPEDLALAEFYLTQN